MRLAACLKMLPFRSRVASGAFGCWFQGAGWSTSVDACQGGLGAPRRSALKVSTRFC